MHSATGSVNVTYFLMTGHAGTDRSLDAGWTTPATSSTAPLRPLKWAAPAR